MPFHDHSGDTNVRSVREARKSSKHSVQHVTEDDKTKEHERNGHGTLGEPLLLIVKDMKVLTVKEAADLLKVKPQWIYRMLRSDGLPCSRLGRQIRIDEDSPEKWLSERRSVG